MLENNFGSLIPYCSNILTKATFGNVDEIMSVYLVNLVASSSIICSQNVLKFH